jgi:D-3-phosphoglycerate dehydrogenase
MKVLLTDQVFPDIEVERQMLAKAGHTLVVASTGDEARKYLPEADAVLTTFAPFPADVLDTMTNTKIIARYGIGVDNIDVEAASARGIIVTNVPDYCVEEVASHSVAMALSLHRHLSRADAAARAGEWGVAAVRPIHRISTLTVGLLGYGKIGRLVATTMATFGCQILIYDPYVRDLPDTVRSVDLDELFTRADVLFLHAPLTAETRGLVNKDRIAQLPQGAIVVNAARGPLIVLDDLINALRSGHLGGAALDTFPLEPLDPSLVVDVPNLLLSPHTAYYSEEAIAESQKKATTQIIKVLAGNKADYEVNLR